MSIGSELSGGTTDPEVGAPPSGIDDAEFGELLARHRDALYRLCKRRAHDPAALDDIVQDALERAFARRAQFDPRRAFWPWLAAIGVRVCIDAHRRAASADARHDEYGRATCREPFDVTASSVLRGLDQQSLGHRIADLPARQRTALFLFALDGWSYDDIARYFGASPATVKSLLSRARTTLREATGRWVAGGVGVFRAARRRAQDRLARMRAAVWPSFDGWLWSTGELLSGGAAVVVVTLAAGGLVADRADDRAPVRSVHAHAPASGPPATDQGEAVEASGPARPAATPDHAARPPGRKAPTEDVERTANHLVGAVLPADERQAGPETIATVAFAESPNYADDPAVFAVGASHAFAGTPTLRPPPLLASHDDAASWQPRQAIGLAPVTRLALAPSYPRDPRLFAVTAKGLQVSHDDGESFTTLLPLPDLVDVAFSPAFDNGDPAIVLVAGQRLWRYDDVTGSIDPVSTDLASDHLIVSAAYSRTAPRDKPTLIVGSRAWRLGDSGLHLNHCTAGPAGPLMARHFTCNSTRLPNVNGSQVPLRSSPRGDRGLLFVAFPMAPLVSLDEGRTFRPARENPFSTPEIYTIYDLAPAPSLSAHAAVVAQMTTIRGDVFRFGPPLARTDDGGAHWTSISVDLPGFDWARNVTVTPTGRIVAGGKAGLGCSVDGGRTWARTCA